MEYRWVLRGGRMQRLKIGCSKKKKQPPKKHGGSKYYKRLEHNKELILQRKESKMSEGESVIAEFLKKNAVDFVREYYDLGLFNRRTNHLLFFDFYIPKHKLVIEFDGAYHYKPINGVESLNKQIGRDQIKDRYCKARGIKILRIPYWDSKKIEEIICQYFDKHF